MKMNRTIGVVIAIVAILLAVASAVSFLLYRSSSEKKYHEKWKDYADCGVA